MKARDARAAAPAADQALRAGDPARPAELIADGRRLDLARAGLWDQRDAAISRVAISARQPVAATTRAPAPRTAPRPGICPDCGASQLTHGRQICQACGVVKLLRARDADAEAGQ